jgi:hypothetical protein
LKLGALLLHSTRLIHHRRGRGLLHVFLHGLIELVELYKTVYIKIFYIFFEIKIFKKMFFFISQVKKYGPVPSGKHRKSLPHGSSIPTGSFRKAQEV